MDYFKKNLFLKMTVSKHQESYLEGELSIGSAWQRNFKATQSVVTTVEKSL